METENCLPIGQLMTVQVACIAPDAPLADCAGIMRRQRISSVVVVQGTRPVGIVTERDILAAMNRATAPTTLVKFVMGHPLVTVVANLDYRDAFHQMVVHRIRHLVVVDGAGDLVGIVSETDFRRRGGIEEFVGLLDVASAMDTSAPILSGAALVMEAAGAMEGRRRATCVLVGEGMGRNRRVEGIVTERDMVRLYQEGGHGKCLREVMTSPLLTVRDTSPLVEAAKLMQEQDVRHLVVVSDSGATTGVLSEHDLVKHTEDVYVDLLQAVIRKQSEELLRQQELLAMQRMQDAVADTEFRYRTILEQLPQKIFIKDKDLRYLVCNGNFAASQGRSIEAIVGADDFELFPPDLAELYRADDQKVMAEATVLRTEEPFIRNGVECWVRTVRSPLRDTHSIICGVVGISEDITEARRLRQEVLALNESLELRVKQRTAELEAANKGLELLARTLSHDLRSSLRAINGYAAMLADSQGDQLKPESADYLARIGRRTIDMADLMDEILSYSRAGGGELRRESVNMGSLARQALAQRQALYPRTVVDFESLPEAQGDRAMLSQVWGNLLDNALKFSSRVDAPRVVVGSRVEAGTTVYFVSDNGPGFDPAKASELFVLFHRCDPKEGLPGHGIGLSIVQRIIARHGGRVWASLNADGGACFEFVLGPA